MIKIAVTGGAGSGKSTACECFRQLGAHVIDLDALAREAVRSGSPTLKAVIEHFTGEGIVASDGTLDRRKLRRIITRDAEARKNLETLIHPEIFRLFQKKLAAIEARFPDAFVVVEVPLLIELGLQDQFDVVVLIDTRPGLQKSRLVERNGCSSEEAQALLDIQMPLEEKRPYADYIVENLGPIDQMKSAIGKIYKKIQQSCQKGLTA
ncbi:MAG: dephospho-CoA kinase [Deltaproteobacteria bacterium]|nr:dephospho-CoA kinase [Deltaproteobacteria bacterium]